MTDAERKKWLAWIQRQAGKYGIPLGVKYISADELTPAEYEYGLEVAKRLEQEGKG